MSDGALLRMSEFTVSARATDVSWADVSLAARHSTGRACVLAAWRTAVHRDERLARRIARDVEAARVLRHPSIARVEGRGTTPDGRWFVAYEYVAGPSIADALDADGRLTPARFVRLARTLSTALATAHAAGIYHGYLTPDNVIITSASEDGRSDVVISGFATAAGRAGTTGRFVPPVADRPYVSPERVAGAVPGARSDLFSLASVLQFALDGSPPLIVRPGTDPTMAGGSLDDSDDEGAAIWHRTVSGVLARARAADPGRRHASVQAFQNELLAIIATYGEAALASPELRVLDRAGGVAALGDGLSDDELVDELAEVDALNVGRWTAPQPLEPTHAFEVPRPFETPPPFDRSQPFETPQPVTREVESPRDRYGSPFAGSSVRGFSASVLRPDMEIDRLGPPRPGLRRPGARGPTAQAVLTIAAAGLVAFLGSFLGRRYADRQNALPVAPAPLVDLSVPPPKGVGHAPVARTTPSATPTHVSAATTSAPSSVKPAAAPTKPASPAERSDRVRVVTVPERASASRSEHPPAPRSATPEPTRPRVSAAPPARDTVAPTPAPSLPALSLPTLSFPTVPRPARTAPTAWLALPSTTPAALASSLGMRGGSNSPSVVGSANPLAAAASRRRGAESVIAAYTRAVEKRDLDALVRIYPSMPERERESWRNFFRKTDDVSAKLTVADAQPVGELVRSEVRGAYVFRTLHPRRSLRTEASFVAMLERTTTGWQIRSAH